MYGLFIGVGARIGFYQGDTLKLLEDIGTKSVVACV